MIHLQIRDDSSDTLTVSGAVWGAYRSSGATPYDYYLDEIDIRIDGEAFLRYGPLANFPPATAVVAIRAGVIRNSDGCPAYDLKSHLMDWMEQETMTTMLISVPKGTEGDVLQKIKDSGGHRIDEATKQTTNKS